MPAWSTTGDPLFAGNVWAAAGAASATSASHTMARSCFTSVGVAEVHARRFLRSTRSLERHLGLGAVEDLRADRVGEGADARIIGLHGLIIVAARRVDAVLGALELVLERHEVGVGLEVGIGLLEALEAERQPILRIVEGTDLLRVAEVSGRELDLGGARPRLSHLDEH